MTVQQKRARQGTAGTGKTQMPDITDRILPAVIRKQASAASFPARAGASCLYELDSGWATRILEDDDAVVKVRSALELEDAFTDESVKTILIPADAVLTRTIVMRVCQRHGAGKTVFFEVSDHE